MPILSQGCQICAQILTSNYTSAKICGACLKQAPAYQKIYALFPYQPPISNLIIRLKFQHDLCIANLFGELICERIQQHWYKDKPLPDLIIPIPLHKERLRERGFNQSLEIAKVIAKTLQVPLDYRSTMRIKATAAQSGLSALKRKINIHQAFKIAKNYDNLSIAVVDDVVTTGHTIQAFCAALQSHKAKKIDIWCSARRE